MRVLIAGTRTYTADILIDAVVAGLSAQDDLVVIEGEAPGADTLAREAAECLNVTVEPYPAKWDQFGKAAGPIRNKQMLDEGKPDFVLAFLDRPESESKGTANMIKQAQKAGLPVYVIERRLPPEPPHEQLELM